MNDRHQFAREDWERIERLINGQCGEDDVLALEEMLRGNPAAQKVLLDYCQLHIDLSLEVGSEASSDALISQVFGTSHSGVPIAIAPVSDAGIQDAGISENSPSLFSPQGSGYFGNPMLWLGSIGISASAYIVLLIFGGALIAAGGILGWIVRGDRSGQTAAPVIVQSSIPSPALTPVAYLTAANGCSWGGDMIEDWTVGHHVESGSEIDLHEGIAEFRLENGVSFSVEGPASLVVVSPTSLLMQYGKITANVPWGVKDFRLLAGVCRIAASDAEFGIEVNGGKLEVHSFVGETRLYPSPFSKRPNNAEIAWIDKLEEGQEVELVPLVVEEGRAILLLAAGDVQESNLPADRSKFTTKLSMGGRLPVTNKYVEAVLISQPVSYWRFESVDGGEVANEVQTDLPLKTVGEVTLSGDARNYSLELGVSANDGHLISDEEVPIVGNNYTVELWCKPSHSHQGTLVVLGQDHSPQASTKLRHSFLLQTLRNDSRLVHPPCCLRFLHRDPPNTRVARGTSCFSNTPYRLRDWQHVVAVKHKSSMKLYVDGQLTGEAVGDVPLAHNPRVIVGDVFFHEKLISPTTYFGQLDELAIYDRALSKKEVVTHFQAVEAEKQAPRQPIEF